MKTIIKTTLAAILLLATSQLFAQREKEIQNSEVEGIYLNADNFKSGKLTPLTDKQHAGDKIKLKQFFISPQIISIEQGKKTVFYKDSIFSIHLFNGENYRFINRDPYLIADTSSFIIDDFSSLFSASLTTAHPMLVVPKSNPKIFFISIVSD